MTVIGFHEPLLPIGFKFEKLVEIPMDPIDPSEGTNLLVTSFAPHYTNISKFKVTSQHIRVSGACPLCQFGYDATSHALFSCRAINPFWNGSRLQPLLKQVMDLEVFDVLLWMKEKLNIMDFVLDYFV